MTLRLTPARSAFSGAALWLVLVGLASSGLRNVGEIPLLFLLAPLVIIPLGLELLRLALVAVPGDALLDLASRVQPFGALLAVVSFFFSPGWLAAGFSACWFMVCLLLTASGLRRLYQRKFRDLAGACVIFSLLYISVGGAWLLASRLGLSPMGFAEPIVLLTAVHFHFAGFAAPLLALATGRTLAIHRGWAVVAFRLAAVGVLVGPATLAAGFVIGPKVKLAGALLVALSEAGLALCVLLALRSVRPAAAKLLLVISAAAALVGMALAACWALAEYPRQPFLDLARMARFHGVTNALGFVFLGLLGWMLAFRSLPASLEVGK